MFVLDVVGTHLFEHHIGGRVATLGRLDPARELAVEFDSVFSRGVASLRYPCRWLLRLRCEREQWLQHRKTRACYYGSGKRPAQQFTPCVLFSDRFSHGTLHTACRPEQLPMHMRLCPSFTAPRTTRHS